MKMNEIKELSLEDIRTRIGEVEETQRKLRLAHSVSQLENPLKLRANRRIIARLKTELKKRQAAEKAAK
jgi:large subunit ribosomal protein L29